MKAKGYKDLTEDMVLIEVLSHTIGEERASELLRKLFKLQIVP
jgi:hypothetical protein